MRALKIIFNRISTNFILSLPSLITLTAAYNKWFWYAVGQTKKHYTAQVNNFPGHVQRQIQVEHKALLTAPPAQKKSIVETFRTHHHHIHTQQAFALINEALLQTTNVITEKLTKHAREKIEVKQTTSVLKRYRYNDTGDDLVEYMKKNSENTSLTTLFNDYHGDHNYERNKSIAAGHEMYTPAETKKEDIEKLDVETKQLYNNIVKKNAHITLSTSAGYLRYQHDIDCEFIPTGVNVNAVTANVKYKPHLVVQRTPYGPPSGGETLGDAVVFILDPKTNKYIKHAQMDTIDLTGANCLRFRMDCP